VERGWGMRLPDERYCLTGAGWGLKEEWESQGEESADEDEVDGGVDGDAKGDAKGDATEDVGMGGVDGEEDEEGAKEDYEGLFGTDETRDREMGDA
ncbi:Transcription initiation factor TFIID subunit 9, partial [Elasticomyces elasticus]